MIRTVAPVVRALARTRLGRRAGQAAYAAVARAVAARLVRLPGVVAVHATGSLLGRETLDPGHSDIDLVVIASLPTDDSELELVRALHAAHRALGRATGGLFYNLDLISLEELPLVRAFGTAWAIELDRYGVCLAGVPKWSAPASRPLRELHLERFTQAFRRWVNASGLLLDPRVRMTEAARARTVDRLLGDIGFAWLDQPRHQPLAALEPALRARGISSGAGPADARTGLALGLLDRFARELSLTGAPWEPPGSEPSVPGRASLDGLATRLLGGPLATLVCYRRAPSVDDWVPAIVAAPDATPGGAVAALRRGLSGAQGCLLALHPDLRRPVVVTPAIWRAAALFDPAPFAGASACLAPRWGEPLPPVPVPSAHDTEALVRARTVESFTLLASIGLRGARASAVRDRDIARRFGCLVPALRSLSTSAAAPVALPRNQREAVALRRAWLAECGTVLAPLAEERLRGDPATAPRHR